MWGAVWAVWSSCYNLENMRVEKRVFKLFTSCKNCLLDISDRGYCMDTFQWINFDPVEYGVVSLYVVNSFHSDWLASLPTLKVLGKLDRSSKDR